MALADDVLIFIEVAETKSFTQAAKQLKLSNALVSKRISHLESRLNTNLFKRTTRQLTLTEAGCVFYQQACSIKQTLNQSIAALEQIQELPHGLLNISSSINFGQHHLTHAIANFCRQYEAINIHLHLANRPIDPINDHFDIVIRSRALYFRAISG